MLGFMPRYTLPEYGRRCYVPLMQAKTANNPVEIPSIAVARARLARRAAAAYLGARMGKNVSVNTIRAWAVRYRVVGRDAVYEIADLDDFADAQLAAASVRPGRQNAANAKSKE